MGGFWGVWVGCWLGVVLGAMGEGGYALVGVLVAGAEGVAMDRRVGFAGVLGKGEGGCAYVGGLLVGWKGGGRGVPDGCTNEFGPLKGAPVKEPRLGCIWTKVIAGPSPVTESVG
jgi:hypothetical protein